MLWRPIISYHNRARPVFARARMQARDGVEIKGFDNGLRQKLALGS